MSLPLQTSCAIIVVLLLVCDSSAQSIGYWHLPSTVPQYCGLGCGPGHHVPIIRTHGCSPPRVDRCVHVQGCLSNGMAYFEAMGGTSESHNCHAELDALIKPESSIISPESAEQFFTFPENRGPQVLPTPNADQQHIP